MSGFQRKVRTTFRTQAEIDAEKTAQDPAHIILALISVAARQVIHVNTGMCPDDVKGANVRDPECPACQVIIAAEQLLSR